jgi:hypothetical protein
MRTVTRTPECCLHVEQTFTLDKLTMCCIICLEEIIQLLVHEKPVPVAERSKAWVCGLWSADIAGSNP